MDNSFLPEHVIAEDEFMLCESFPSNKCLEGVVRMVWPVHMGILRAVIQLKDAVNSFEVNFYSWPEEYQVKLKDNILLLLKGATKSMKAGKKLNEQACPFRVCYKHGAICRVQGKTGEFWVNYLQEEADATSGSVVTSERIGQHTSNHSSENLHGDVYSCSPDPHCTPTPLSPLPKKAKRKRRHKNRTLKERPPAEHEHEASLLASEEVRESVLPSNDSSILDTQNLSPNAAKPPFSYTAIGDITYKALQSIIGVVIDVGMMKTTSTGDIMKSFILVDSSAEQGLTVNIFVERQNLSLLPPARTGQLLLLRNVHIQKFNGKFQGVCYKDKLQWCGYDPSSKKHFYSTTEITTDNSVFFPILQEEMRYFSTLTSWWNALHETINESNINVTFPQSLAERRNKLRLVSELKPQVFSDCVVELIKVQHIDEKRSDILVTDFSENQDLQCYSANDDFPLGKRTLKVTLWEDAKNLVDSLIPGKIYLLQNVKIKSYGFLEGSMGGYEFKGIHQVDLNSLQPHLPELLARKKAYEANPSSVWLRPKSPISDVSAPLHQSHDESDNTSGPLVNNSEVNSRSNILSHILQNDNSPKQVHIRCRIVDYYPRDVIDFIHLSCGICGKKLSILGKQCLECGHMAEYSVLSAYRFVLRVVDQNGNGFNVRVSGKEAENLLGDASIRLRTENHHLLSQRLQYLLGHLYKFHETFAEEDRRDGPWIDLTLFSFSIDNIPDVYYEFVNCSL